jgi:hypothetical protein
LAKECILSLEECKISRIIRFKKNCPALIAAVKKCNNFEIVSGKRDDYS